MVALPPDKMGRVKDDNGELIFDVRHLEEEGGAIKVLQEVCYLFNKAFLTFNRKVK